MIAGKVDDYGRALVSVVVRHPSSLAVVTLDAWIDTGFTGFLLLPSTQIDALALSRSSTLPGAVADGSRVLFETFACLVEWFGTVRPVEAIGSSGNFALVGVSLLEDCTLVIDYPGRKVSLTSLPPSTRGP